MRSQSLAGVVLPIGVRDVCKRGAITFDEHQKAHIDKEKRGQADVQRCAPIVPL